MLWTRPLDQSKAHPWTISALPVLPKPSGTFWPPRSATFSKPANTQLSGSAFCGKRTTPPFCRSFCRFPQTPSCSKALGPVVLRASHPLPRSPRFRGERGWERLPSILRMDGPQTGGFCRPSCRFRGRSQPAHPARVIPAGTQLRDDGATRAPALVEFLEDPAHAPHHPPHRGPPRALPHAPLRRAPRACRRAGPGLNAPQHALFTGFARFSSVPPRARIGMMSRITTRGPPYGDRHIPARPNAYVLTSRSWLRVPNGEPQEWYEK